MKKNITKELQKMRIDFLKKAIKEKIFSHYALSDFKKKMAKLKKAAKL